MKMKINVIGLFYGRKESRPSKKWSRGWNESLEVSMYGEESDGTHSLGEFHYAVVSSQADLDSKLICIINWLCRF